VGVYVQSLLTASNCYKTQLQDVYRVVCVRLAAEHHLPLFYIHMVDVGFDYIYCADQDFTNCPLWLATSEHDSV